MKDKDQKKSDRQKKTPLFSFRYLAYDIIRLTAAIPGLIWFRPKKIYASPAAKKKIRGGAMIMSNHTGFFDPMYLLLGIWYRRPRFVATKELFSNRFKRFLFTKCFMCIEIDRERFGLATFREIVGRMKSGQLLGMFPEGHINRADGVGEFKSGVVMMAQKAGVPVVPIYIVRRKGFFGRLKFVIGEPIDVDKTAEELGVSKKDYDAIAAYLRKKENELLELGENKKGKKAGKDGK